MPPKFCVTRKCQPQQSQKKRQDSKQTDSRCLGAHPRKIRLWRWGGGESNLFIFSNTIYIFLSSLLASHFYSYYCPPFVFFIFPHAFYRPMALTDYCIEQLLSIHFVHGIFSKTNHILRHKASLKCMGFKVTFWSPSCHNVKKLELKNKRGFRR